MIFLSVKLWIYVSVDWIKHSSKLFAFNPLSKCCVDNNNFVVCERLVRGKTSYVFLRNLNRHLFYVAIIVGFETLLLWLKSFLSPSRNNFEKYDAHYKNVLLHLRFPFIFLINFNCCKQILTIGNQEWGKISIFLFLISVTMNKIRKRNFIFFKFCHLSL